jgi:microcin C transport system permease protein
MRLFRLTPQTRKKLRRFREIRRGYYSFLLLLLIAVIGLGAELLVNSRALIVSYEGELYFPTYGAVLPGTEFGLDYRYETDYRELQRKWRSEDSDNWLLMPLVPWNPYENDGRGGVFRPEAPSIASQHYLGTDSTSRDILARLVYGTRIALLFAVAYTAAVYFIGIVIGCAMGYFGGLFDMVAQRLIEIWSNVPFLYMVIIVFSVVPDTIAVSTRIVILLLVLVLFSWTGMTYYMRTETYKEKSRDYVAAARVMGASNTRIVFSHILPNIMATLVTFMPFTAVAAIGAITSLDFLGFGMPVPTPSLGELLKQGTGTLRTAPWIVITAFSALVLLLTLVTFIGEALREAFDPKKFTVYR